MPHSFGKCTLLYIEGMKNFVSYLQISPLQTEVVPFEIKGVFVSDCQIELKMETKVFQVRILGKLVGDKDYSDHELENLNWEEKSRLIQSDPVMCA